MLVLQGEVGDEFALEEERPLQVMASTPASFAAAMAPSSSSPQTPT